MKKYASFIMLFVFLFITNGYFLYFKYLQYDLRHEMQMEMRNIHEKELIRIVLSPAHTKEIRWIRKNKEFLYRGKMYDVVRRETRDGHTVLYCLNDVREHELMKRFRRTQRSKDHKLWQTGRSLANKYFPEQFTLLLFTAPSGRILPYYNRHYRSLFFDPAPPPPRSCPA